MKIRFKNKDDNGILYRDKISAQDFNVQGLKEDWLQIPHPHGEMKMKQWIFDGVRMVYSDGTFTQPVTFDWEGDLEVITLYYNLKGIVSIGDINGTPIQLHTNQQNMFFGSKAEGFMKVDELRFRSFMIQFNKKAFLRIAGRSADALKFFADQVTSGKTAVFSPVNLPIDISGQQAIDAILNCKFSDSLKRIFFLSKVMELIVLQAEAHTRSLSGKPRYLKSDYDRERIIFARDYVLQHIDMPPSIPELAKIVGINEFKLKKGYKEIFGSTIFGHLAEARLEQARTLLQESTQPVSEIAFQLGYASVQHFSNAFKKKYGVPPGRLRK